MLPLARSLVRSLATPLSGMAGASAPPVLLPGDYPLGPGVVRFDTEQSGNVSAEVIADSGFWRFVESDGALSDVIPSGVGYSDDTFAGARQMAILATDESGLPFGNLVYINMSFMAVTAFAGGGASALDVLYLNNNLLSGFSAEGMDALYYLDVSNNNISDLGFDVSMATLLGSLIANNNQLTTFDTTGLASLFEINLSANLLTSFDGSGFPLGFDTASIADNLMNEAALEAFFVTLTDPGTATLNVQGNPGAFLCDTTVAVTKGYTVVTS